MPDIISSAAHAQPMLSTDRLILRELREEDWHAIHAYCSMPAVRKEILPGQRTESGSHRFVRCCVEHAKRTPRWIYAFGLVLKNEEPLIGTCVLTINPANHTGSIGWDLDMRYWRSGLMTEAAIAVVGFGFEEHGLKWISADCFAGNRASIRVMEKLGMRRQKLTPWDELRLARGYGVWRRIVRCYLSAADWRAKSPGSV